MKRSILRNQKGFTLIEALITIVIVGILGAIAVPVYTSYTNDARCMEGYKLLVAASSDFRVRAAYDDTIGSANFSITSASPAVPIVATATVGTGVMSYNPTTNVWAATAPCSVPQ